MIAETGLSFGFYRELTFTKNSPDSFWNPKTDLLCGADDRT